MDASKKSLHVYGKTPAGTNALSATRGAMSSLVRQLLILIDGKRTIGELSQIFPEETLNQSLDLLESQGLIECLEHFADTPAEADHAEAPPARAAGVTAQNTAPPPGASELAPARPQPRPRVRQNRGRRRNVAVAIGACSVALLGGYAFLSSRSAPLLPPAAPADPPGTAARAAVPAPAPAPRTGPSEASPLPPAGPAPATEAPLVRKPSAKESAALRGQAPTAPKPAPLTRHAANEGGTPRLASGEERPARIPTLTVRNQVMPQLPEIAKALGIVSGHVAVVLHVNPRGTVDRVELLNAAPPQVYDAAMEQAFRQWTFDPLGIPGRMTVEIEVTPGPSR